MRHYVEGFTKVHKHDVYFINGIKRSTPVIIALEQLCACRSAGQKTVLASTENFEIQIYVKI